MTAHTATAAGLKFRRKPLVDCGENCSMRGMRLRQRLARRVDRLMTHRGGQDMHDPALRHSAKPEQIFYGAWYIPRHVGYSCAQMEDYGRGLYKHQDILLAWFATSVQRVP